MTEKGFKKTIVDCLRGESLDEILTELRQWLPRRVISPLIGCLCHGDERVRWHAVSALGAVTAVLAETDPEYARTVIRRLMWSLNEESGGIGWGAPEALGEIMAVHEGCAEQYGHILVAYMRPDGWYLELSALQRGLMWGLGRLAGTRPDLLLRWDAPLYLQPYLDSGDPEVRGLAAHTLGLLKVVEARERIEVLTGDTAPLTLYTQSKLTPVSVGSLAEAALERLSRDP